MRWDYLWLIPPLLYLLRAADLLRDSRRTLAATRTPPMEPRVLRVVRGMRLRDALRLGNAILVFGGLAVSPLLADLVPPHVRLLVKNWLLYGVLVLLSLAGESDAADRRRLYDHHRPHADREAGRQ